MNVNSTSTDEQLSSFQIVKNAFLNTNKHFVGLISDISFSLLVFICMFVPLWVWYAQALGADNLIVAMFKMVMHFSLLVVILFMLSLSLFNRTHPSSQALTFWRFTKEISWPWMVEGIKASVITTLATLCLIVPGIIKYIHYTFFSFVVFFNKDYKEGKIDALKHSKQLSKGLGWWILGIYGVLPSVFSYFSDRVSKIVFAQADSLWVMYPSLVLNVYIMCLFLTYVYSVLYFMYAIKDQSQMVGSVENRVG